MEIYAAQARLHMEKFGTTERQIAAVAAKNHTHSKHNPLAQYQFPLTLDEVLQDRMVAWPLTRAMCAPISDGAAALVIASERTVARLGRARAVPILGIGVSSGSDRAPNDFSRHLTGVATKRCYEMAGLGPEQVSIAEVHDATAIAEIIQIEQLGLCPLGEGGRLSASGETAAGGRLPVNVSGGLLSKGHPIGATGAMQLCELVTQLRGEAGARQVNSPMIGLAENGGGFQGVEEAACVVTLLGAPRR
jgi:acetyl-CoA acetyltransferase